MARVIIFSTRFPAYHSKAGDPTFFVEKFYNNVYKDRDFLKEGKFKANCFIRDRKINRTISFDSSIKESKGHTIRLGDRWKAGEYFSPRIWCDDINPKSNRSGPYHSKQFTVAPDTEVKKVWEIKSTGNSSLYINNKLLDVADVQRLAFNDGLGRGDLLEWFRYPKSFEGQIICWDENINY